MSGRDGSDEGSNEAGCGRIVGRQAPRARGKVDRVAGRIKQAAEEVVDKVKSTIKRRPAS